MKILAKINTNDFTVLANGDAFISQRKAAELLGVPVGTFMSHIRRMHKNTNTVNGLDDKTLILACTYFAYESSARTPKAKEFINKLMEAGAKAYIYHEAGYQMNAVKVEPPKAMTRVEAAMENLRLTIEVEKLEAEVRALEVSKALTEDKLELATDKIKTDYDRVVVTEYFYPPSVGNYRN